MTSSPPLSLLHQEFDVQIEKLVVGGDGLTRVNGKVCFVPLGLPQDQLRIQITEEKKDFCRGEILSVTRPSPHRREAPCPYFGTCGGCSWQHLKIEEQEKTKADLVSELLGQKLKMNFEFLEFVKSPQEYFYRNRISLKSDGKQLGYYQRRSHDLVPISKCLLADERINEALPKVQKHFLGQAPTSVQIFLKEDSSVDFRVPEDSHDILGFSQVNEKQNQNLIRTVIDWTGDGPFTAFYDFYAGSGNFTFPVYDRHRNTTTFAVESDPSLTEKAQQIRGARTKIKFFTARVETFLKSQDFHPDSLILLDPPRGGCESFVMKALAKSRAKKIIMISCHPASLARDLGIFFSEDRTKEYSLGRVQCFDMFPQTDHVETVAEIVRR